MKRILTMRPWKLFLALCSPWILALFMPVLMFTVDFRSVIALNMGMTFLMMVLLLGWFYVLGTGLQERLPDDLKGKMKVGFFKFNLAFPAVYIMVICVGIVTMTSGQSNISAPFGLLTVPFIYMQCLVFSMDCISSPRV